MSEDETNRKRLKPDLLFSQVLVVFRNFFPIDEKDLLELKSLDSYDDQNFFLKFKKVPADWKTNQFVLKIHNGVDSRNSKLLEAQNQLMALLHSNGVRAPLPLPSNDGQMTRFADLPTKCGERCSLALRLLTFLPGEVMSDADTDLKILEDSGSLLGKFTKSVEGSDFEGFHREHSWDLQNALGVRDFIASISAPEDQKLVEAVLNCYERLLGENGPFLRKSIIMGDINDANMVMPSSGLDGHNQLGMIDFGDTVYSWTVNDLAIAMAYALLTTHGKALLANKKSNVTCALAVLKGYCSQVELTQLEIQLLHTLMCTRLAMSVTFGAYSYSQDPSNEYLLLHASSGWASLRHLWAIPNEVFVEMAQEAACPATGGTKKPTLTFVTGNMKKLEEVKAILGDDFPYEVVNRKLDLPELQGLPGDVAVEKCALAAREVGGAVICEDVSLGFNALNGMPGPYIKWFLKSIGNAGLVRLLADYDDKSGYAQCIFAFCSGPGEDVKLFDGRTPGNIVSPRGDNMFGWDPIFEPKGYDQTFAELALEEKNKISHRRVALNMLKDFLEEGPPKPTLTFVTGNMKKLEEVKAILGDDFPYNVINKKIDLPELQGPPEEVAVEKCSLAAKEVGGAVICEDVSLCFNALNGMPGPYVKWFLQDIGCDGMFNMLHGHQDKSGYAQCIFAFCPGPDAEVKIFDGRVPGMIVPPSGDNAFGWDPIFQPQGYTQTYAELPAETKNQISHRRAALDLLRDHFGTQNNTIVQDDTTMDVDEITQAEGRAYPTITFVTGNPGKLREVTAILGDDLPFKFINQDIDLPELQGTASEVAIEKCKLAAEKANGPVICEDVSLCFNALGGLPGPYIKWFLKALGPEGLYTLLNSYEDKTAYAECVFGFCLGPGHEVQLFEGRVNGVIVTPRGENAFGWDPIFQPDGFTKTFSEMDPLSKNSISHRNNAVQKLKKYFQESAEELTSKIS